jgi:Replication initiator protein A
VEDRAAGLALQRLPPAARYPRRPSGLFPADRRLERWLYRLARKAVPEKADVPAITFRMQTLHQQSSTTRALKLFAYDVRKIADTQPLPEYSLRIGRDDRHELVTLPRSQ